ncbi:MAG: hypothetical protein ACRD5J_16560 [Nitrososphaeraceae archaeon]
MQGSAISVTEGNERRRDHMSRFTYALKSQESRRQCHRRLKVFLDFLDLHCSSLDEQALQLLSKVRDDPRWFEDRFMDFIVFQIVRVRKGEIAESTIPKSSTSGYHQLENVKQINEVNGTEPRMEIDGLPSQSNNEVVTVNKIF